MFDDRDRLVVENAPEGRVQTSGYDNADRLIRQTLNAEPTQIRKWDYDGRGVEISHKDGSGATWTKTYDNRDRLVIAASSEHGRFDGAAIPEEGTGAI